MEISGNTILITGGGSGIGRGLAEALHAEGNQIIIAGRRKQLLDEVVAANPGMHAAVLDITDSNAIDAFAGKLLAEFPGLNVVVHNAGIMRMERVAESSSARSVADGEAMVTTNLLGPMRLTAALLPALLKQQKATLMTVTSGLAFVPLAPTPTYCATKAALHSYSESLRYQLRETSVEVLELIPPYVQTELTGAHQASDPHAMPLAEFIEEVVSLLKSAPQPQEICVKRVNPLRYAEARGEYAAFFKQLNDGMAARSASR